jgi:hypothetical protein
MSFDFPAMNDKNFQRSLGVHLKKSHLYFACFSLTFAVALLVPLLTKSSAFDYHDIFQSENAKTRVQIVSSIGIGISYPLIVDGVLDFSIKNLLKRWIYWGMISSIIIPSALDLFGCVYDVSSLYLYSVILAILLRFSFLIISVLAVEFDSLAKLLISILASFRVVLFFLWSIVLFRDLHNSSSFTCEIAIFICDCLLILLLLYTFHSVKEMDPEKLCLKVHCLVLALLLTINVVTFLSNPNRLLYQLIQTTIGTALINVLKACIVAVATVLPNRIHRASAEDLNVCFPSFDFFSHSAETIRQKKRFCSLCLA